MNKITRRRSLFGLFAGLFTPAVVVAAQEKPKPKRITLTFTNVFAGSLAHLYSVPAIEDKPHTRIEAPLVDGKPPESSYDREGQAVELKYTFPADKAGELINVCLLPANSRYSQRFAMRLPDKDTTVDADTIEDPIWGEMSMTHWT